MGLLSNKILNMPTCMPFNVAFPLSSSVFRVLYDTSNVIDRIELYRYGVVERMLSDYKLIAEDSK
jgi:hypothetical protein